MWKKGGKEERRNTTKWFKTNKRTAFKKKQ